MGLVPFVPLCCDDFHEFGEGTALLSWLESGLQDGRQTVQGRIQVAPLDSLLSFVYPNIISSIYCHEQNSREQW